MSGRAGAVRRAVRMLRSDRREEIYLGVVLLVVVAGPVVIEAYRQVQDL